MAGAVRNRGFHGAERMAAWQLPSMS
jgi:hypothetical protein